MTVLQLKTFRNVYCAIVKNGHCLTSMLLHFEKGAVIFVAIAAEKSESDAEERKERRTAVGRRADDGDQGTAEGRQSREGHHERDVQDGPFHSDFALTEHRQYCKLRSLFDLPSSDIVGLSVVLKWRKFKVYEKYPKVDLSDRKDFIKTTVKSIISGTAAD